MISDHALVLAANATYLGGKAAASGIGSAVRVYYSIVDGIGVIAFEGTHDPAGWMLDFLALHFWDHPGDGSIPSLGWVHAGFLASARSVLADVIRMAALGPYALAGHSLGGALALLVGGMLIEAGNPPVKIGAFAPPRVGDARFIKVVTSVPVSAYRFGNDPVTQVPFHIPYFFPYQQVPMNAIGHTMPHAEDCHAIGNYLSAVPVG